jgi:hypothetical protein
MSATVIPPAGAGPFKVTIQAKLSGALTVDGLHVTALGATRGVCCRMLRDPPEADVE